MKKITQFFCILFLLFATNINAQADSFSVKITNQYQVDIARATITIEGQNTVLQSNINGMVCMPKLEQQQLKIEAENHSPLTISYQQLLKQQNIVKLHKKFTWKDLFTPMFYIINGGLWLILFIIFAETGLFVGFFLPGDSLLFVAGIYNHELIDTILPFLNNDMLQLAVLWLLISAAGILGNTVGYWFGNKVGPAMYHWKDNIIFKKHYLHEAHDFYEKHGGGAIIFARFIPIVRTFAPIIAGIVSMDKKKFSFFNIVGSLVWVLSMLIAGHFLQKWILSQFGFDLKKHLEVIVIGIVFITTAPVLIKLITSKRKQTTA